jgi:hypothetical protein
MKTFELSLGIILIVASLALRYRPLWSFFTHEEWHPFQIGLFRNPVGTVVEIVLGLALLFGGGFMIWLSSR